MHLLEIVIMFSPKIHPIKKQIRTLSKELEIICEMKRKNDDIIPQTPKMDYMVASKSFPESRRNWMAAMLFGLTRFASLIQ